MCSFHVLPVSARLLSRYSNFLSKSKGVQIGLTGELWLRQPVRLSLWGCDYASWDASSSPGKHRVGRDVNWWTRPLSTGRYSSTCPPQHRPRLKTYSSFLYRFVELLDDIHSFHSIGLKALCPRYQVSLQTRDSPSQITVTGHSKKHPSHKQ